MMALVVIRFSSYISTIDLFIECLSVKNKEICYIMHILGNDSYTSSFYQKTFKLVIISIVILYFHMGFSSFSNFLNMKMKIPLESK